MLDPQEASVKLDTPGNPTTTGWSIVTPEAWKFRWSISDKIMQGGPALDQDYYEDPEWYWDLTKAMLMEKIIREEGEKTPSDLAAVAIERYLEGQTITIRPYEMLLGCSGYDQHTIAWDVTSAAWASLERMAEVAGRDGAKAWIEGKKRSLTDEEWERLSALADKLNMTKRVMQDMTPYEAKIYFHPQQPTRYFESFGTTGGRPALDHDYYLKLGLRKLVDLKRQKLEEYESELQKVEAGTAKEEKLKDKIENAKAAIKVGEATIRWIKRHAEEAYRRIHEMPDERAKEILRQAAANCEWVAENPPRTFWEAMQLYWFGFIMTYNIEYCIK